MFTTLRASCHTLLTVTLSRSLAIAQAVADFPPQQPRFSPRSDHMGFVLDKVALGQFFLSVLFNTSVSPTLCKLTDYFSSLIILSLMLNSLRNDSVVK
jgi:hypothetical protein